MLPVPSFHAPPSGTRSLARGLGASACAMAKCALLRMDNLVESVPPPSTPPLPLSLPHTPSHSLRGMGLGGRSCPGRSPGDPSTDPEGCGFEPENASVQKEGTTGSSWPSIEACGVDVSLLASGTRGRERGRAGTTPKPPGARRPPPWIGDHQEEQCWRCGTARGRGVKFEIDAKDDSRRCRPTQRNHGIRPFVSYSESRTVDVRSDTKPVVVNCRRVGTCDAEGRLPHANSACTVRVQLPPPSTSFRAVERETESTRPSFVHISTRRGDSYFGYCSTFPAFIHPSFVESTPRHPTASPRKPGPRDPLLTQPYRKHFLLPLRFTTTRLPPWTIRTDGSHSKGVCSRASSRDLPGLVPTFPCYRPYFPSFSFPATTAGGIEMPFAPPDRGPSSFGGDDCSASQGRGERCCMSSTSLPRCPPVALPVGGRNPWTVRRWGRGYASPHRLSFARLDPSSVSGV